MSSPILVLFPKIMTGMKIILMKTVKIKIIFLDVKCLSPDIEGKTKPSYPDMDKDMQVNVLI
jgi:hypothetical protein